VFPQREPEILILLDFLKEHCVYDLKDSSSTSVEATSASISPIVFPEPSQELLDELEALAAIYEDDFAYNEANGTCILHVEASEGEIALVSPAPTVDLLISFPAGYPEASQPVVRIQDSTGCTTGQLQHLLSVSAAEATEGEGMPVVYSIALAVSGALAALPPPGSVDSVGSGTASDPTPTLEEVEDKEVKEETLLEQVQRDPESLTVDDAALVVRVTAEAAAAAATAAMGRGAVSEGDPESYGVGSSGRRRQRAWNLTVGLVGKPSAGKSTFFNAVKTSHSR
jgi:hypothetical protein